MNVLIKPDGQPVPHQVTVTGEQAVAVVTQLIDAQLNVLLQLGINQPTLAQLLLRKAANYLAAAQPAGARQQLTDQLILEMRQNVAKLGREADLAMAVVRDPAGIMR